MFNRSKITRYKLKQNLKFLFDMISNNISQSHNCKRFNKALSQFSTFQIVLS